MTLLILLQFEPQKGPRQGGTMLTVEGENLGKRFEDIQGGITVAGVPCIPDEDLYEPTVKWAIAWNSMMVNDNQLNIILFFIINKSASSNDMSTFHWWTSCSDMSSTLHCNGIISSKYRGSSDGNRIDRRKRRNFLFISEWFAQLPRVRLIPLDMWR